MKHFIFTTIGIAGWSRLGWTPWTEERVAGWPVGYSDSLIQGLDAEIVKDQTALRSGLILHLHRTARGETTLHPSRGHVLDYQLRLRLQSDQTSPDWGIANFDDGHAISDQAQNLS